MEAVCVGSLILFWKDSLLLLSRFILSFLIKTFFFQIPEVIIQNIVTVGLFRKEKCLDKLPPWFIIICHLSDDMNENAIVCTRLRVYGVNENFAILKFDLLELFVDSGLTLVKIGLLAFDSVKIVRILGIETVKKLRLVVHMSVILDYELPGDSRDGDYKKRKLS